MTKVELETLANEAWGGGTLIEIRTDGPGWHRAIACSQDGDIDIGGRSRTAVVNALKAALTAIRDGMSPADRAEIHERWARMYGTRNRS